MIQRNYCMDILIENATSYTEKSKIYSLTEAEQAIVNDKMVGNLYKSAVRRKDIDFGDIPNSKGDIQKFSGYDNMVATMNVLRGLSKKFGINIPEIEIVEDALNNLRVQKNVFEKGYSLNIDFLKMYYQALVLACIDASTLLLASYVEFTKTVNTIEFQLKRGKGISGNICIDSLASFNASVKDRSFNKLADSLFNKGGRENFLGVTAAGAASFVGGVAIAATVIPVLRGLIFYFYDAKMSVSERLMYQKELLEMNAFRLNSASMDAQKRNKILDKQKGYIDKLERLSDKFRVTNKLATKSSTDSIKQDNKNYNIANVTNNGDDFMFI